MYMLKRRLGCLWLAMVMVLQLCMPVWAEGTDPDPDAPGYTYNIMTDTKDTIADDGAIKVALQDALMKDEADNYYFELSESYFTSKYNDHQFVGWFSTYKGYNDSGNVPWVFYDESDGADNGNATKVTDSSTIIAVWTEKFFVTFNANGGTPEPEKQLVENSVTEPSTDPTKAYNIFAGWNKGATEVTFPLEITENTTLTAQWTPFSVDYNLNDTNASVTQNGSLNVSSGEVVAPTVTNSDTSKTFKEWNTKIDGSGESIALPATVPESKFTDGTLTLYAIWEDETPTPPEDTTTEYTATFTVESFSSTANNGAIITVTYDLASDETITFSDILAKMTDDDKAKLTSVGYDFDGWYTENTYTTKVNNSDTVSNNVSYFAKWTETTVTPPATTQYKVTFMNGTTEVAEKTVDDGTTVAEPDTSSMTAPTGKVFKEWNEGATGNGTTWTFTDGVSVNTVTENTTLYAIWQDAPSDDTSFKVYLNILESSAADQAARFLEYTVTNETTSLNDILATFSTSNMEELGAPADYMLDGWYYTYSSGSLTGSVSATTAITETKTYYAQWVEIPEVQEPFTVILNIAALADSSAGAGDGVAARTISYNSDAAITLENLLEIKLTDTEKEMLVLSGYALDGWYGDSKFTIPMSDSSVLSTDITVYARWACTVTFDLNSGTYNNAYTMSSVTGVVPGATIDKPDEDKLNRNDYNFVGWFVKTGTGYSPEDKQWNFDTDTVSANMTLYAKWDIVRMRTVTVNLMGGTIFGYDGNEWTESVEVGHLVTYPGTPTLFGYIFTGWMQDVDGDDDTSNDEEWDFYSDTVEDNMYIYATWTIDTSDPVISIQVTTAPNIIEYFEGETFDPTGLILYAITAESQSETVVYSATNAVLFDFSPDLSTALTLGLEEITVTYKGCSAVIPISVTEEIVEYFTFGTVRDAAGNTVEGAIVRLYRGDTVIADGSAVTNENGYYEFMNVAPGNYNLTVTYGYKSRNFFLYIPASSNELEDIYLPSGNVSSNVYVYDAVPYLYVSGLDEAATYLSTGESDNDIINVSLEFTACNADYDKEYIQAYKNEFDNLISYFDISLYKNLTFTNNDTSARVRISEVDPLIQIALEIPEEFQGMETYTVYRMHNNVLEKLSMATVTDPSTVTEECITVNAAKTQIVIYARKFSTYALSYSNVQTEDNEYGDTQLEEYRYTITPRKVVNGIETTNQDWGGNFYLSNSYPIHSTKVMIYPTCHSGFVVSQIEALDSNGNTVAVQVDASGVYYFTQGSSAVTLTVYFSNPELPVSPEGYQGFFDVSEGEWYYDSVIKAAHLDIMAGIGGGFFNPKGTTTRGMIVQILYNLSGSPEISQYSGFYDVDPYKYYAKAVNWAKSYNVVSGYSDGSFRPEEFITREELATILFSYAEYSPDVTPILWPFAVEYGDQFAISPWATTAVTWCTNKGVFTGKGANLFMPNDLTTRAEVATCILALIGQSV